MLMQTSKLRLRKEGKRRSCVLWLLSCVCALFPHLHSVSDG